MTVQPISPGAIVSRIWEIYRDQFSVLVSTAVVLFSIQFVLTLVLSTAAAFALAILFWALSVLYQGIVVELVKDIQDGRRDHSSPRPHTQRRAGVLAPGRGLGPVRNSRRVGFVFLIVPGLILLVIWSVVAPVMVLERPGIFAAFGRSRQLVHGNGWMCSLSSWSYFCQCRGQRRGGPARGILGSVAEPLYQWALDSALAPITALSASVLYFALVG